MPYYTPIGSGNGHQSVAVKDQIISAGVLTHYNPTRPITLAADASAYGVGAVISHVLPDNSECPIGFASRTVPLRCNVAHARDFLSSHERVSSRLTSLH